MKQTYESEEVLCYSREAIVQAIKSGLDLLAAYAPVTITYDEQSMSSLTLNAYINAGQGSYFRVRSFSDDNSLQWLYLYQGFMRNGEFVSVRSVNAYNLRTGTEIPYYSDLAVVNNGDLWDFGFNTAARDVEDRENRMRSFLLKSSLDGQAYRTALVYQGTISGRTSFTNSSVYKDDGTVGIKNMFSQPRGQYNVTAGTILLSPALLQFNNSHCLLGVPTVGDETVYLCSTNFAPLSQFALNGMRYISFGDGVVMRCPQ